jgi:hypothetical protein
MMNKLMSFKVNLIGFLILLMSGSGQAESINDIQARFEMLPRESRRLTGPLFWLHGDESKELLESYVEKVAEGGNGCFTAESRPHSDWLGEGWYRDLQICLDAAKKHDLKMWIFDEKWWPSGEVGGKVPRQYGSKYMQAEAVQVQGPQTLSRPVSTEKLIAVLAGKVVEGKIDGESLVDLTDQLLDGSLNWQVPQGDWQVMVFRWDYSQGRSGNLLVDGASRDAVDWYIQTVYQPHYDRFKDDFGTWIPGFFYDEPETYGDWGTEVIPLLKDRSVDWKKALTAWKFELAGDQQSAARYQYQDAFAEAWGRTLFGGITDWCHEHGVKSIGHFLEHRNDYLSRQACAGNMFQLQKYSDMGGIDAVFAQFVMGKRNANDHPTWQTPKLGSSISHVYGKADDLAMVEIFGARGQDLTYPEMKWWTDHMHVSGINFHIPHSFNPRAPYDTDCPPYFYHGGQEPRWPLYPVYADYTSRLSLMLSGGRHVCPVALLFAGNSVHVGRAVTPEQISEALQDALYDCDWMPYEVFEKDVRLDKREMNLYQEQYRVLIVPPVEVIPYETLKKASQFFRSGGVVVGYDFLPTKASDIDRTSRDISKLREAIWGDAEAGLSVCKTNAAGGRSYFLPANPTPEQMQQVLAEDAGVRATLEVLEGDTGNWLHVLHRVKDGRDIFFVCNQNVDGGERTFRFRMTANGFPECWDPMRAEITSVPFTRSGEQVELTLKLDPLESALLVFNAVRRDLPERIDPTTHQALRVLPVVPVVAPQPAAVMAEPTLDPLDGCSWIWQAGENATAAAKPGSCYFRGSFDIPKGTQLAAARFIGTADNEMAVFVNGWKTQDEPAFADWRRPADVEITDAMVQGHNTIAISVLNATNAASPAGLIGKCELTFADGSSRTIVIDEDWKAQDREIPGWEQADFDDSRWAAAAAVAPYGAGPWGTLGRMLTLSPVKQADPFTGRVDLPADLMQRKLRYILHMENVRPEAAVRITINGTDAGGCIGGPLDKDVTAYLAAGTNVVRVEPFTPGTVEVLVHPAD